MLDVKGNIVGNSAQHSEKGEWAKNSARRYSIICEQLFVAAASSSLESY